MRLLFFTLIPLCIGFGSVSFDLTARAADLDSPGAADPVTDPAIYGQGIRSTSWRTPQAERDGFHLPAGFEIRLFASEPQIAKPLNIAFDSRGRLWVTHTIEYPYPVSAEAEARDRVSILEDSDGDGTADRVTTFADGLNIPMGILPYGDGCLCFSIPNIYYLRDTDNDGRCDDRQIVLGPFDTTRDTHGMINSLRDGGDGWIYACHGFNNQSQVAGTDEHVVTMHSGNTFRFRPDGSRVEHVTHGQVNPFGMTEDDWGYRYTADCHSKPITQLVFGACYPSFGKPHDGLGFLPPMMDYLHGSTAISGLLFIPPHSAMVPLRGQFISGNVMTSRLNRTALSYQGATAKGKELSDFMTSDDPWFRPVDICVGPAGHIYVADFYNKIIGHYEVPLDHPERDRTSGRIWQIRYQASEPEPHLPDDVQRITDLKRLSREQKITDTDLQSALTDQSAKVRVAALRLATAHLDRLDADYRAVARDLLKSDENPHVAAMSAELLGRHGGELDIDLILARLGRTPQTDAVLRQTLRIAIRDRLRDARSVAEIWNETPDPLLADVLLGLNRPESCKAILDYLSDHPAADNRDLLLAHAVRTATPDLLEQCVLVARSVSGGNRAQQFELLDVLCTAVGAAPGKVVRPLRDWASGLIDAELQVVDQADELIAWTTDNGGNWPTETRRLRGGGSAVLTSSLGRGEKYTGRLRSDSFAAPQSISFWLAGHNGFPDQPDHGKNRIRLIADDSGEVLRQATPPRNDVAKRIVWDTAKIQGRRVHIECIDGDSATAYAWLGFGGLEPAYLHDSSGANALRTAMTWIKRLGLVERADQVRELLERPSLSTRMRINVARTLASLTQQHAADLALQFLSRTAAPADLTRDAIEVVLGGDVDGLRAVAKELCKRLSANDQVEFARAWIQSPAALETLVSYAESGWVNADIFTDATVAQAAAPKLNAALAARVEHLVQNLGSSTEQQSRLTALQKSVAATQADGTSGKAVFGKHCAACHQLRGEGQVVGPQLDGAATRSADRLLEDIVTPDRNVDRAFRTTSLLLEDGRVIIGLVVTESADEIRLVQPSGMPVTVDPQTIDQRRDAGRSLMPGNMVELLTPQQFADLIDYIKQ